MSLVPSFKEVGFVDAAAKRAEQSIPTRDIQRVRGGYWDSASASLARLDKNFLCIRLCKLNWYGRIVFFFRIASDELIDDANVVRCN